MLLMAERFGLAQIDDGVYAEAGADEAMAARPRSAMSRAKMAIGGAYGSVVSRPLVYALYTEACNLSFGGTGSRAQPY
jgi:hypothetical protein